MEVLFYLFLYLFKLILNDCSYLAGQYCVCMFNYFSGSMWPDNLSSICAVAELQKNPFNRHLNTQSFSLGRNKINDNLTAQTYLDAKDLLELLEGCSQQ